MSLHFSERLTTENTVEVHAKVGTRASRIIYVHTEDLPLEKGKHIRYLNGFHTQEPTEHGFYPEYGVIDDVRSIQGKEFYLVSLDGSPRKVEALDIEQ